jgi:hypothetical protein
VPFKVEVQLKDSLIKLGLKSVALLDFPLTIDYGEGNIFVRFSSVKTNGHGVGGTVWLEEELRRGRFIKQFGVEYVEFVPLDDLWRWVFTVIVSLIVFIPFIPLFDTIKESRFSPDSFLLAKMCTHKPFSLFVIKEEFFLF